MATPTLNTSSPEESLSFTISKTWDGRETEEKSEIHIRLFLQPEGRTGDTGESGNLSIQIDAPYFNDPQLLSPPGSTPNLWDYEVVEVFFLGEEEKYLEVELAPNGQYLLLQLNGVRNIIKQSLPLDHYVTEIRGNRWFGEARVPLQYFPPKVDRMNAYCIYKSDPFRVYMALFPAVPEYHANTKTTGEKCHHQHQHPDFHRLEYFQRIDLPGLCNVKSQPGRDNFPN